MSLADAKKYLRLTGSAEDDELRSWVESITAGIEGLCGPVIVRTVTQRIDFRREKMVDLRDTPVVELVSLEPLHTGGASYAPADCDLDPGTGIVRRLDGGTFIGPLVATTRVGRQIVPAALTSRVPCFTT